MSTIRRRLIAVDAQNLLACHPTDASAACWEFAIVESLHAVGFCEDTDHLVIAVAPEWAFTVKALAPFARLMVRGGRHGADLALCNALDDASFIASRYSEVVVASGSHLLRRPVRALADAGVPTTVACLPHHASSALTATAAHVTWLEQPWKVLGDAAMVVAVPSVARVTYALALALKAADARPRLVPLRARLGLAA